MRVPSFHVELRKGRRELIALAERWRFAIGDLAHLRCERRAQKCMYSRVSLFHTLSLGGPRAALGVVPRIASKYVTPFGLHVSNPGLMRCCSRGLHVGKTTGFGWRDILILTEDLSPIWHVSTNSSDECLMW